MENRMNQLTKCVHAGLQDDLGIGGVTTPIYMSSSYKIPKGPGEIRYPRRYNIPTQRAAAEKVAALENGETGLVLASGMAAITSTLLTLLKTGDHAIIQSDVYGGTYHFAESELRRFGIEVSLVRGESIDDYADQVRPNTKVIFFETPTNPLIKVTDVEAMAGMAKDKGLLTVIDNTFATPINQRPLDLGIDVVIHSGSKYLGGHSDLCCGVVVTSRSLMDRIYQTAVNLGGVLGAIECYQLERSIKTLGLRVKQHNKNGLALAQFLATHPWVKQVNYPGLPDHPGHGTAKKQMDGFGGMLSIDPGDVETARRLVENLTLFTHAVSLGGVESLVCFPALTSHSEMAPEDREKLGITDSLLRLSVGIEDTDDLIADFDRALKG